MVGGYTGCMENITLRVDEDVLAKVRRVAEERETTVDALVSEYLARLAEDESHAEARKRILELAEESRWEPGEKTWSREDLHER